MVHSFPVVVYGNSLLMSGVAATLLRNPALRLLQVNPDAPLAQETLHALHSGVLLCDWAHADRQVIADFIFTHPQVTVIGLHFAAARAVTLACQEHALHAPGELRRLVQSLTEIGSGV